MDDFDSRIMKEFQELEREMGRMLRSMSLTRMMPLRSAGGWRPAVDVYETESEVFVYMETAGIDMETLAVAVKDGHLLVTGKRQLPRRENVCCIHQLEIELGHFSRTVSFSVRVDATRISMDCRNGILEIRLPKETPAPKPCE